MGLAVLIRKATQRVTNAWSCAGGRYTTAHTRAHPPPPCRGACPPCPQQPRTSPGWRRRWPSRLRGKAGMGTLCSQGARAGCSGGAHSGCSAQRPENIPRSCLPAESAKASKEMPASSSRRSASTGARPRRVACMSEKISPKSAGVMPASCGPDTLAWTTSSPSSRSLASSRAPARPSATTCGSGVNSHEQVCVHGSVLKSAERQMQCKPWGPRSLKGGHWHAAIVHTNLCTPGRAVPPLGCACCAKRHARCEAPPQ